MNHLLQVGEIVYWGHSPQKVGKVIEVYPVQYPSYLSEEAKSAGTMKRFYQQVKVRWLRKGNPEEVVGARRLLLLEDLIADHETKLKGHRGRLREAQAL